MLECGEDHADCGPCVWLNSPSASSANKPARELLTPCQHRLHASRTRRAEVRRRRITLYVSPLPYRLTDSPTHSLTMPATLLSSLRVEVLFTQNAAMDRCLKLAAVAAESDVPTLILGETGTGKTLLAEAIHNSSARGKGKFVSFNASAMSDTLLESQLFGHERGAFTGAQKAVKGKFELAHDGTLFFDEIADMSALAQAKILRAVEYGEFERLGSERMLRANVRIISATNTSLRERIRQGRFREDLYHRLAGLILLIPPLRERF